MLSRFNRLAVFKRHLKVNIADIRKGDWIELDDGKRVIVHNLVSSHSGRGSRSFLLTVKDPSTESINTIKPTGRDMYERLELRDVSCKYLYSNEGNLHLIDERSFEELSIAKSSVKDSVLNFLEDGMSVKLRLAQDSPVSVVLPRILKCTVAEVLESSEGTDKRLCIVKTQGGARITCSVSLQPGDSINIDTEELTYQGRINKISKTSDLSVSRTTRKSKNLKGEEKEKVETNAPQTLELSEQEENSQQEKDQEVNLLKQKKKSNTTTTRSKNFYCLVLVLVLTILSGILIHVYKTESLKEHQKQLEPAEDLEETQVVASPNSPTSSEEVEPKAPDYIVIDTDKETKWKMTQIDDKDRQLIEELRNKIQVNESRLEPVKIPRSVARTYATVNLLAPQEYWDYDALNVKWSSQDNYEIVSKVGRGKYSEVFSGVIASTGESCIIKVLKPVRSKKIKREIKILQAITGGVNIIQLLDLVREPETKTPAFIFELVKAVDHKTLYPTLSDLDVRHYIFQLLKALEYAHSRGIMHRDVKPHNVMIDPESKTLRLIDWGLAEFYHPTVPYNVRVASRYYKGPELLVDFQEYDYSLDLWSLGCMFAGMIFMKDTFFHGRDNDDQLFKIVKVLGNEEFMPYLNKYSIKLDSKFKELISGPIKRVPFESFITEQNKHLAHPESISFLSKLLRYDHQERYTCQEAMKDSYFDPVRSN